MPPKTRKFLLAAFLAVCLLPLAACQPEMGNTTQTSQTIEVLQPSFPPVSHQGKPPLYCKAGHGSALFGRDWYDFQDTSFILYQDERTDIKIFRVRSRETMTVQGLFDSDGQRLVFCPVLDVPAGRRIACASSYALEDDLQVGIKRTFDIRNAIRGGMITCSYQQANLKSLTTSPGGGN